MEGPLRVLRWAGLFPDYAAGPTSGCADGRKRSLTSARTLLWLLSLAVSMLLPRAH